MNDTAHIVSRKPLTQEEIEKKRLEKLQSRRYFVVSFTDKQVPQGKVFRCWDCGEIIQTIFAEPREMIEIQKPDEDISSDDKVGGLCRKCNMLFLFVWYGHN